MKETIRYSFVLFLFCFVAALLLSVVHAFTEPRIENMRQEQEIEAVKEVLPGTKETKKIDKGDFSYYLALGDNNKTIGYIVICQAKGYSSVIKAIVSVGTDAKIVDVRILEEKETPGIGSKIKEVGFLGGFKGKDKEGNIDSITGATISSSAVIKAVKEAIGRIPK